MSASTLSFVARLHASSNVSYMDLEAQPWIADFRIATALDSFPFFRVLGVEVFLGCWGVPSCFVLPTPPLSAGAGLGNPAASGVAQDTFSEFLDREWGGYWVSRPVHTACSVLGCGLGNRATQLRHGMVCFSCYFIFRPADPPPVGAGGDMGYVGYSDCDTGLCDFLCSLFSAI